MKAGETRRGGGRKCGGTCLWGLATDGGGRKNHGKPASPPTELGANKTSYASAKIGDEYRVELRLESLREQHGKPGVLAGTFTLAP